MRASADELRARLAIGEDLHGRMKGEPKSTMGETPRLWMMGVPQGAVSALSSRPKI